MKARSIKDIFFILMFALSLNSFSYAYSYDVSGEDAGKGLTSPFT